MWVEKAEPTGHFQVTPHIMKVFWEPDLDLYNKAAVMWLA